MSRGLPSPRAARERTAREEKKRIFLFFFPSGVKDWNGPESVEVARVCLTKMKIKLVRPDLPTPFIPMLISDSGCLRAQLSGFPQGVAAGHRHG